MTWKNKSLKEKVLSILSFIWHRVVVFLVIIFFFVGVFFNLWKVQELSFVLSLIISLAGAGLGVFAMGKLLKIF